MALHEGEGRGNKSLAAPMCRKEANGKEGGQKTVLYKERISERKWSFYPKRREEASSSLYFENHF